MNKALNNDEMRRKRLRFRSWHRGWKETDLILGAFADAHIQDLSEEELTAYEAILDEDDAIIWAWVVGKETPPEHLQHLIKMIATPPM